MRPQVKYEATLRPKKGRFFRKKVILNQQIPITRDYSFKLSIWIPDTPESRLRPSVVVTLQHNGSSLSFSFPNIGDMVFAFGEIEHYISQKAEMLYQKHQEALQEWTTHQPPLYDYTDTVIQGEDGKKVVVNRQTGEIIGRVTPISEGEG